MERPPTHPCLPPPLPLRSPPPWTAGTTLSSWSASAGRAVLMFFVVREFFFEKIVWTKIVRIPHC